METGAGKRQKPLGISAVWSALQLGGMGRLCGAPISAAIIFVLAASDLLPCMHACTPALGRRSKYVCCNRQTRYWAMPRHSNSALASTLPHAMSTKAALRIDQLELPLSHPTSTHQRFRTVIRYVREDYWKLQSLGGGRTRTISTCRSH